MYEDESDDWPPADRTREIHSIVLAEILSKSGDFDLWRYFEELNRIKRRPLSATWLEAYVMICCVGQIRPAKVVGHLKRLREKLSADAFDIFDQRVRAYMHPLVLTNHGFRENSFAHVDPGPIWAHVQGLMERLEGEGFKLFLNSGTLLGVVRDQSLIAHDDDVDLAILLNSDTPKAAAAEWQRLKDYLRENGLWEEKNQKTPEILKLTSVDDFEVDLFPAWVQGGRIFVYPHTFGELHEDDVLPLRACKVTGRKIPRRPEKMLAINYGERWQTPDPLFKFPWAAANANFADFLQELQS